MSRAHPQIRLRIAPAMALAALLAAGGCQAGSGPIARWRMAHDTVLMKDPTKGDLADDRGLMARWLDPARAAGPRIGAAPPSTRVAGSDGWGPAKEAADPAAEAEFRAAEQLFRRGRLTEAEPAFARIAKARKDTGPGERAQFYLAETQYQLGHYVAANDSFEKLLAIYPGTRYADKAVAREYAIGQAWLASYEGQVKPEARLPWHARLTGGLPFIDVGGHALQALEHVRHHDPTGPLADDAVLRIADHHYRAGNYEEAAEKYDELIIENPKSPFLRRAQLASIDAKLKSYIGPEYDGTGLEQARETVKQTMAAFPERQASGPGDELYRTLDVIADQKAERAFVTAKYYREAGAIGSAEYYYAMIAKRWPKSPWAAKAKDQLAQLAKAPRRAILPSKIMTLPGSSDPYTGAIGGGGMGGMGAGPQAGSNGINGGY